MPIDARTKIDLVKSDPYLGHSLNGGPLPDDDYLTFQLGSDYREYLKLRRDGHITSQLLKRKMAILARRVIVEPVGENKPEKQAAEVAERLLDRVRYESFCNALLEDGPLAGFSVVKLDYDKDDENLIYPSWEVVPQTRIRFAFYEPDNRTIPTATGEDLDPATEICLVRGYELRLLTRDYPLTGVRVPKWRMLCFVFGGRTPYGLGLGYQLYPWWLVKNEARKSWLLHSDRIGTPPVIGNHPPEADTHTEQAEQNLFNFGSFLEAIAPNGWVDLPTGFEVKVLEGGGDSTSHESLIKTANDEISKAILGEVSYSEKSHGSYGANQSQVEDRESTLTDGDCNLFDEQLQPWWDYLIGLNAPKAKPPVVRRETIADRRKADQAKAEQEAIQQRASRDATIHNQLGLNLTEEYVAETYGEGFVLPGAEQPWLSDSQMAQLVNLAQLVTEGKVDRFSAIQIALMSYPGLDEKRAEKLFPEPKQQDAAPTGPAPTIDDTTALFSESELELAGILGIVDRATSLPDLSIDLSEISDLMAINFAELDDQSRIYQEIGWRVAALIRKQQQTQEFVEVHPVGVEDAIALFNFDDPVFETCEFASKTSGKGIKCGKGWIAPNKTCKKQLAPDAAQKAAAVKSAIDSQGGKSKGAKTGATKADAKPATAPAGKLSGLDLLVQKQSGGGNSANQQPSSKSAATKSLTNRPNTGKHEDIPERQIIKFEYKKSDDGKWKFHANTYAEGDNSTPIKSVEVSQKTWNAAVSKYFNGDKKAAAKTGTEVPGRDKDTQLDAMAKAAGISKPEAEKAYDSIRLFTGSEYTTFRAVERGQDHYVDASGDKVKLSAADIKEAKGHIDSINTYVKNAPTYDGEIYRGMSFDSAKQRSDFLKKFSSFDAMSSFSSNEKIASEFADGGSHGVLLKVKNKSGVSVRNISNFLSEDEVLVPGQARYRIASQKKKGKVTVVELEEIDQ